jgi:hypothetical protein
MRQNRWYLSLVVGPKLCHAVIEAKPNGCCGEKMKERAVTLPYAKRAADGITAIRLLLAAVLVWLGLAQGAGALPLVAWLMLADWIGDCLDGPLARRSRTSIHTWWGDHDLQVDMLVAVGLLLYMAAAGYAPPGSAGLYLLAWAALFAWLGSPRSLGMLSQTPIYLWFVWVALQEAPAVGRWLVIVPLLAIVITWPRFPKEVIPGFLAGMKHLRPSR